MFSHRPLPKQMYLEGYQDREVAPRSEPGHPVNKADWLPVLPLLVAVLVIMALGFWNSSV